MKNLFYTIILITAIATSCTNKDSQQTGELKEAVSSKDNIAPLPSYNIPVRSQIKWKSDSTWRKIEKEEERQFDSQENLVKWIQYMPDNLVCEDFKYGYEGNRITRKYRKFCSKNFDPGSLVIIKYGANGRVEEELTFYNKRLTDKSKFKFKTDKDTFPYLREDYVDGEDRATAVSNLTYDKFGRLLTEEQLVSGSWFGTYSQKFNSKGQLIYQTNSVDGGVGLVEYFYFYNDDMLIKDSVNVANTQTEYHVYDNKEIKTEK